MMRTAILVAIFLVAPIAAVAGPKQVRYVGIHPVPTVDGGGLCHIEGPHVHVYAADRLQFREHEGAFVFVGDPVGYGYEGPRYAYKGHHPIDVHVIVEDDDRDIEWCYLDGPHYHPFAPTGPDFILTGGAYFYVAKPPKVYFDAKPKLVQINAVYKPLVYERPVITVGAPAGWIGARVDVVTRAKVVAPVVRVPSATIWVDLGMVPGVGVFDDYDHHHYRHHHRHHKHKHKHKKFKRYDDD